MTGQHPPGHPVPDPHQDHYLDEGPTRLDIQWLGVCRCGQEFRGLTAEDIYTKSQLHINRHVTYPDGAA
jgi:hypothetical protein